MSNILFPVGRMVGGSMYKPRPKTDALGKPVVKDGVPVVSYSFALAVKKTKAGWWEESWGAEIYKIGAAASPAMVQRPDFAWKITDGDSTIPNKKGKVPNKQEGYPGHWVIWLSQSWAPKLVNANGTLDLTEPDSVLPGYFIEVYADVKGNGSTQTAGVYINPVAVALAGYGERIALSDVDTTAVGFGGGAPVAGMSATPPAAMAAPAPGPTAMPGPYVAPAPGPAMAAPAPNAAFLAPPPPAATPVRKMTAAATTTYEQYVAAGWSDAQMIAAGVMVA